MDAIVAMDPNRVIGDKGKIPWHYKEDFKWFKRFTMGKTLIMGRTTYEDLPVPLKGRKIVIITSKVKQGQEVIKADRIFFRHLDTQIVPHPYLEKFNPRDFPDAVVCGGSKTYQALLPYCDNIYVTHICDDYEGDTCMPYFEDIFSHSEIILENKDFFVVKYSRS
jgi:dihydrofolate reductase